MISPIQALSEWQVVVVGAIKYSDLSKHDIVVDIYPHCARNPKSC